MKNNRRTADRPGPQEHIRCTDSGMILTASTGQRAAGGDRPRSGGSMTNSPHSTGNPGRLHVLL